MFDLHTHTTFSDGVLIPAESARRALVAGYSGIAITDHADMSNYMFLLENILRFKESFNAASPDFKVLAGLEITHVLPSQIAYIAEEARKHGADVIIVHGETIVEPVAPGTNRAAIEAKVDILAHPGLITLEEATLAAANGVRLEITTRKGHSHSNALVALAARQAGATLVVNNDFHTPGDYLGRDMAKKILLGVGLNDAEAEQVFENNRVFFNQRLQESARG